MQYLLGVIFLFLYLVNTAFSTKHALHMFQQNRYELPRYLSWLHKRQFNYEDMIINVILAVLFIVSIFIENTLLWISYLALVIIIKAVIEYGLERKKDYIKPLVYTARVKRQIITLLILNLMIIIVFWFIPNRFWSLAFLLGLYINWVLILLMYYINQPMEKMINEYYLKDARKIINGIPSLKKIGITGSYGKTSTKNILDAVLSDAYYTLKTPLSYNTPMGITKTIREYLKPIHEVFICEMGADKVGEIDYLTKFVKPHYGIVTSIGPQHLNTFLNMENIIKEKMLMIENLPSDGISFINIDNRFIREYHIKNKCKLIKYGIKSKDVDYYVEDITYHPQGSTFMIVDKEHQQYSFSTKLLGEHNIMNILVAVAVGRELDISWETLQKTITNLDHIEHRLQLKKINGYTFIDNAFNSNPEGAAMSLEVLSRMENKRFIITPGMIDLGERQDDANREFGRQMNGKVDYVILVGKSQTATILEGLYESGFPTEAIQVVDTVKEAFAIVYQLATPLDTILLENDLPDAFNR